MTTVLCRDRGTHHEWTLANAVWEVTVVPEWGGQITSLLHRTSGWPLVRVPPSYRAWDSEPYLFGIPILFPPGRIRNGEFRWGTTDYRWPKNDTFGPHHVHGFVSQRTWLASSDERGLTLSIDQSTETLLETFLGSPVSLRVTYQLMNNVLKIGAAVKNLGGRPIPFGLGFHTTWDLASVDWHLKVPPGQEWEMGLDRVPRERLLEKPQVFAGLLEGRPASMITGDTCYRIADGEQPTVDMWNPESGLRIRWAAGEDFRQLVIYRPSLDTPWICVEPYTWISNAPNMGLDARVTGLKSLRPGEERVLDYSVVADS